MAKKARKDTPADASGIKLRHPDRSGPTEKTLLDFAGERSLFDQAAARQRQLNKERGVQTKEDQEREEAANDGDDEDDDEAVVSPLAERILDTLLWCISLAMLHFTLDVLVQNQYAVEIEWPEVAKRSGLALAVFSLLFYNLHRHASDPRLLPGLPTRLQYPLRQVIFFVTSSLTGCYLIHITNKFSYMAVMQQAPPIGCLWIWSVIELDLTWAVVSLAIAGGFMKLMGYGL